MQKAAKLKNVSHFVVSSMHWANKFCKKVSRAHAIYVNFQMYWAENKTKYTPSNNFVPLQASQINM